MGVVVNASLIVAQYTILNVWFVVVALLVVALKIYTRATTGVLTTTGRLDGKTVVVTGANDGIGYETAKVLAERGARVILACRNLGSAHIIKANIIRETQNDDIEVYRLDLSSLWSVRQFAKDVLENEGRIDLLILNAGIGLIKHKNTADDLPLVWQINHFAPFLLINLLLDFMKKSKSARIIYVTSVMHHFNRLDLNDLKCEKKSCPFTVYCNTKLATLLTSNYLAEKLKGTGITVNCVNPGLVQTYVLRRFKNPIFQYFLSLFLDHYGKSIKDGAATTITLALDPALKDVTGKYFADCKESNCYPSKARDMKLAQELWEKSEELCKMNEDERHIFKT